MMASPRTLRPMLTAMAALVGLVSPALPAPADSLPKTPPRGFRAFLPRPGEAAEEPGCQLVQVLLDRQAKPGYDSYLIQALFRGKPPARAVRVLDDRVEIDFLDAGKPAMRLARIRGGVIEASSLDELYYREGPPRVGRSGPRVKRLVRLTLYTRAKPVLSFRDTLDRTLIHFRLEGPRIPAEAGSHD